jgi:transposase-like protein
MPTVKDPGFLGGSDATALSWGKGTLQRWPDRRKYADELRERAVRLSFESDRPIADVAHDLGIHKRRRWAVGAGG